MSLLICATHITAINSGEAGNFVSTRLPETKESFLPSLQEVVGFRIIFRKT